MRRNNDRIGLKLRSRLAIDGSEESHDDIDEEGGVQQRFEGDPHRLILEPRGEADAEWYEDERSDESNQLQQSPPEAQAAFGVDDYRAAQFTLGSVELKSAATFAVLARLELSDTPLGRLSAEAAGAWADDTSLEVTPLGVLDSASLVSCVSIAPKRCCTAFCPRASSLTMRVRSSNDVRIPRRGFSCSTSPLLNSFDCLCGTDVSPVLSRREMQKDASCASSSRRREGIILHEADSTVLDSSICLSLRLARRRKQTALTAHREGVCSRISMIIADGPRLGISTSDFEVEWSADQRQIASPTEYCTVTDTVVAWTCCKWLPTHIQTPISIKSTEYPCEIPALHGGRRRA
eukprot:3352720-Prymnesium_polylepis.2